jgi:hypothetical protein
LAGCDSTGREWSRAEHANTVEAYEAFIAAHPADQRSAPARERIVELHWDKARQNGTVESLTIFLEKWPESQFAAAAVEQLALLELMDVEHASDPGRLYAFLQKWPKTKRPPALQARVDSMTLRPNNVIFDTAGERRYMGALSFPLGSGTQFSGRLGPPQPIGPVVVYVFRDVPEPYAETIKTIVPAASSGDAYLWIVGSPKTEMPFFRRVDIAKPDDALARELGLAD